MWQVEVIKNKKRKLFGMKCLIKSIMFETVFKDLEFFGEIYVHKISLLSHLRLNINLIIPN